MTRKIRTYLSLFSMPIMLLGCGWMSGPSTLPPLSTDTPTVVPTCEPAYIELTSTASIIKVGETLTLTAKPIWLGAPR